jgi:hypothetical protein
MLAIFFAFFLACFFFAFSVTAASVPSEPVFYAINIHLLVFPYLIFALMIWEKYLFLYLTNFVFEFFQQSQHWSQLMDEHRELLLW